MIGRPLGAGPVPACARLARQFSDTWTREKKTPNKTERTGEKWNGETVN